MEQTKYDVFISYSRKDYVDEHNNVIPGNEVSKIKDALTKAGISYWFDEEGIYSGDDFASEITNAIRNSQIFLFISSVNSNQSKWTSNEISTALEFNKKIIPLRLDKSPYNDSVMMKIISFDYIECKDEKKAISKLLRAIRHHIPEKKQIDSRRVKIENIKINSTKDKRSVFTTIHCKNKVLILIIAIIIILFGVKSIFFSSNKERVAIIENNGKYGLGTKEKVVLKCEYDSIENVGIYGIGNEYFLLYRDSKQGIADTLGQILLSCEYDRISKSYPYFIVSKDGKQGVMDSIGKNIIPLKYKSLSFTNYYDRDCISLKIYSAKGFIAQDLNDMWSILSTSHEYVVKPNYYHITDILCGYKLLNKDSTYSYLSSNSLKGFCLIDRKYKDIIGKYSRSGLLLVLGTNNKYGYINILGHETIPCKYAIAKEFSFFDERAFVKQNSDEDWTCIDTKGNIIFTTSCDSVGDYWDGKVKVFKNGKQYEFDKSGNILSRK